MLCPAALVFVYTMSDCGRVFFFSSRRRHTRWTGDWSSDVCSSDLGEHLGRMIGRPDVDVRISEELDTLLQAETEVAVDFTRPGVVMDNVRWAIEHVMHIVVGTSGIGPNDLEEIARLLEKEGNESNVVVAPNFAIGAVLLQRFAERAAESVRGVRGGEVEGVRIHSVRLPGLVAHQEVIFGGHGETLTMRHDSTQ